MNEQDTAERSEQQISALREQVLALMPEDSPIKGLHLKVSPKGALSLWGLRRMPVTLYKNEWELVLSMGELIRGFIRANPDLVEKGFNGRGGDLPESLFKKHPHADMPTFWVDEE